MANILLVDDHEDLELKEKYNPNIPIVLLSVSPELLKTFEECKADDIIETPFDLETVHERIKDVLKKYQKTLTLSGLNI